MSVARLRERMRGFGGGGPLYPLAILFGLNAVDELDRTAFGILLPEVRAHFELSLTGVTALTAAVIPASLLFAVPIGYLADRHRRVPIALAGACTWAVFSVGTGLAPTILILALARVGSGLGRAVNDPCHGSLLSDYYPAEARAKVFGAHRAANTVGNFFGPLGAGFIAAALGWRAPFIIFAVPTIGLVVYAFARLREPERTGRRHSEAIPSFRDGFRILWGVRTLRRLWLAFPFLAAVAIGLSPLFSLFYDEIFEVGVRGRGVIGAFDAPFIVAGLLIGTPLIDRGIRSDAGRTMRRIGLTTITITLLICGVAASPWLGLAIAFHYGIVALSIILLAGGTAIVSLVAPPDGRGVAFALFSLFSLVGVVALPVVGVLGDTVGLRWGMAALSPILVFGALIVASAGRFVAGDMARALGTERPEPEEIGEATRQALEESPIDPEHPPGP